MADVTIRRAIPADMAEMQRLNKALYTYENSHRLYEDSFDLEWTYSEAGNKYFRELLSDVPNSTAFVAESDGKVIGYLAAGYREIIYRAGSPVAEIENMCVEEGSRRSGVGRALVETFKQWAEARGAKRLRVTAFAGNAIAISFYRKCGFHDFELTLEQEASFN
jgi:GNAT superfamily N-acetyltransferase